MSATVVDFPAGVVSGSGTVERVETLGEAVGIVTDRTPFHPVDPSWPDQPADTGTLNGVPVLDCLVGAIDADGVLSVGDAITPVAATPTTRGWLSMSSLPRTHRRSVNPSTCRWTQNGGPL